MYIYINKLTKKEKNYINSLALILFNNGKTKEFTPKNLIDETIIQRNTINKGDEAIAVMQLLRLEKELVYKKELEKKFRVKPKVFISSNKLKELALKQLKQSKT